ncbi:MAG: DNA repair protein RecN [Oscillospiraceae bacterium]
MLRELTIQNIAVIRHAVIGFSDGFNVFSGETGAGKSILIGAIGAVLGERTSKDLIRTGEQRASVSALFSGVSEAASQTVRELGIEFEPGDELLMTREITADHNSCRINGQPATVAMLRTVGLSLINTHGQQDNQMLSSPDSHRGFIDAYGRTGEQLAAYRTAYHALCTLNERLAAIETDEASKAKKIEELRYQADEIDAAHLIEGEEQEMAARRHVIRNAAALTERLSRCREALCGGEEDESDGAILLLDEAAGALAEAGKYLDGLSALSQTVIGFRYELDEIAEQARESLEQLEYDPRELEDLEERLDLIGRLKRKYGATVGDVLAFGEECRHKLEDIELSEERIAKLTAQCADAQKRAVSCAEALTVARRESAGRFVTAVTRELTALDMPAVRLEVSITARAMGEMGADEVEFLLAVNPGEAPRPLAKTASGGEMSRIMLAIKSVISGQDDIGTLIFDEIDAGISGRAAQKVGAKLRVAARGRQIICVTHLAQVAAFADHHLLIEKRVAEGRTFTEVTLLDSEGRTRELARIMGGEPITPLALQSAAQLLEQSQEDGEKSSSK